MTVMNGAYVNGLDNRQTNAKTVAAVPGTATTDYIIFSLTVHETTKGDIYYGLGNNVLASGGTVTDNAATIIAPVVMAGVTTASCQRVWLSLGGAGSETFTNIQTILNNGGTAATNLINNLVALATRLLALSGKITSVGFDMDNEDAPPSAVVPLIVALYNKGISLLPAINFQFTFCPYTDEDGWCAALASVYSDLKGVQPVVGFNLQTYSGGEGNNPVTWTQSLANYLTAHPNTTGVSSAAGFILPILSMDNTASPTKTPAHMKADLKNWGSTGASFWATQALFQSNQTYTWKDYAAAIAAAIAS